MRYIFTHIIKVLCVAQLCMVAPLAAEPVRIFAAASLREVLNDIAQTTDQTLIASYAGSGTIARQVNAGAPADVIALADGDWIDWLARKGTISPQAAKPIASNTLVVIGPAGAAPLKDVGDLVVRLGKDRLAIGHHLGVPAGTYAQSWLERRGLWAQMQGQLAETENVRAALALVARGQAQLGIVYATDAQASTLVATLFDIPSQEHKPITYFGAALTSNGARFLDQITSPEGQNVFTSHGFVKVTK